MMKIVWALLVGCGASIVLYSQDARSEKTPEIYAMPDAYEVYSAILPDEWTWRAKNSNTLLIKADTVPYRMCLAPDAQSRKLLESAITSFGTINRKTWRFDRRFDISKPYELILPEVLSASFNRAGTNGWPDFNAEHPNSVGWIELSAVGFNDEKTVAVVYVGHHCGGLCGGGQFRVLHKVESKWRDLPWTGGSCAWFS